MCERSCSVREATGEDLEGDTAPQCVLRRVAGARRGPVHRETGPSRRRRQQAARATPPPRRLGSAVTQSSVRDGEGWRMSRLVVLVAILLAAPAVLSGCAPRAAQQAEASCEQLGLNVRVLDGQLGQMEVAGGPKVMLAGCGAEHEALLRDNHPDDPAANRTLPDRQARDLDRLQESVAA